MNDDFEKAERFSHGRALAAPFLGLLVLLAQQGTLYVFDWGSDSLVQIFVWLGFAIVMLALLLTGGAWILPARVRRIADDEVSRANRQVAIVTAYIVAMVVCLLVWAISPFEPLHAQRAANMIVSTSLGTAFVAYGLREALGNAAGD